MPALVTKWKGIPEPINLFERLKDKWRDWDLPALVTKWKGIPEPINLFERLKEKWRDWDLNPEPMAYESTAPPLSYLADNES